jgi:hypothetical protein
MFWIFFGANTVQTGPTHQSPLFCAAPRRAIVTSPRSAAAQPAPTAARQGCSLLESLPVLRRYKSSWAPPVFFLLSPRVNAPPPLSHSRKLDGYNPPCRISSSTKQSGGCTLTPPSSLNLSHPPSHLESLMVEVFPAASVPAVKPVSPQFPSLFLILALPPHALTSPRRRRAGSWSNSSLECARAAAPAATGSASATGLVWWAARLHVLRNGASAPPPCQWWPLFGSPATGSSGRRGRRLGPASLTPRPTRRGRNGPWLGWAGQAAPAH